MEPEETTVHISDGHSADEITVDEAIKRLREMTQKRAELSKAITAYKKYIKGLIGRL